MDDMRPLCCAVLTGTSWSRRDQPREFIESLKEVDAMVSMNAKKSRDVEMTQLYAATVFSKSLGR
ncbi:hypothetical protein CH063_08945 [Colletotrichum higginsianum]|uniref:Uncharacterized protein n=1 Tax=Colletotrichum higginsianum (strain IMI 349063) TaxID=759273 RepID=H1VBR6_COLHI|nr:hypothetical protein CH063_08945 [Colletotrichum higginsianum]